MHSKRKFSAWDIALVGLMTATIEVGKIALNFIPNVELVSILLIVYSVVFGPLTYLAATLFSFIEGMKYGFGWWWPAYLYAWPLLVFLAKRLAKKHDDYIWMSLLSGLFGLSFGMLCEISYAVMFGLKSAFAWWIAGIPYDIIHGVANFIICLALYKPLTKVLKRLNSNYNNRQFID